MKRKKGKNKDSRRSKIVRVEIRKIQKLSKNLENKRKIISSRLQQTKILAKLV